MNYIKHSTITFAKETNFDTKKADFESLSAAAHYKGYLIKSYSEASTMLISLGLYDESQDADSVSTIDSNGNVYIFVNDKLTPKRLLYALAHEIGHIELEHKKSSISKQRQEKEADMFAHCLLSNNNGISNSSIKMLLIFLLFSFITASILCAYIIISVKNIGDADKIISTAAHIDNSSSKHIYTNETEIAGETKCYFVPNGTVYHIYRDCSYIKNSATVYTSTIENSQHERMCSRCKSRLEKEQ